MIRGVISALVILAATALFVRSCSGPRPRLVSARMRGQSAVATVANDGFGDGLIEVQFTVRGASGAPVVKIERTVLAPHQEVTVQSRIDGARGDEDVEVELDYPPR